MSMSSCMNKAVKQSGAAMVEFALILPILIVLVFGITEMGRAIYQQNTLDKAIASGVRYMSRSFDTLDEDCNKTGSWSGSESNAKNLVVSGSEQGGDPLLPGLTTGDVSFTVEQRTVPGSSDVCVILGSASVSFRAIFGDSIVPLLDLGPITLTANSEERYYGE